MNKRWWGVVRLLVSLGLLVFVLLTIGLERIGRSLLQADLGPFLLAFVLFFSGVVVRAARWRALLVTLDIQVPFGRLVYLYFVGSFFNAFLPTGFGGDVVRVLELSQDTQGTAAAGTVFVDRMTGLLVLFGMALLALPFSGDLVPVQVRLAVGLLSFGGLLTGGLILQGRWLRRLGGWLPGPLALSGQGVVARVYQAVTACGQRAVGKALAISLIFNILLVLLNYLAAHAVGMRLALPYFMLFVPVLSITLMLPVSVGGLGVREGMAVVLFTQAGVNEAVAAAASLAVYAISTTTGLFGGLLYLIQNTRALREAKDDEG